MDNGWIRIHRKIAENSLYFSEKFTRAQAWIDLLILANHTEGFLRIRGNKVVVCRGQVGMSKDNLGQRWKWSKGKVLRFLEELEKDFQIVQQKNNVTSLISICNYEMYQTNGSTDALQTVQQTDDRQTTDGLQTDYRRYANKKDKNVKNENNVRGMRFTPPLNCEVIDFFTIEMGLSPEVAENQANNFILFYESKGWMVGKNKMVNWKSAAAKSLLWLESKKKTYLHPSQEALINTDTKEQLIKF